MLMEACEINYPNHAMFKTPIQDTIHKKVKNKIKVTT